MAVTIINRNVNIEHTDQKGPEGFGTTHIITSYVHLKGGQPSDSTSGFTV